jgi:hypothetical protein
MRPIVLLLVIIASTLAQATEFEIGRRNLPSRVGAALFEADAIEEVALGESKGDPFDFGHFSVGVSAGLMLDPVGFGTSIEGEMWLLPMLSVGTRLTLGVGGETFFLGLAPTIKGIAPLPLYERTLLFAFVGPGLAYISHTNDAGHTDSEVGFMLSFGTGIDIHFARWFSLGGGISFYWLVTRPADEGFIWMLDFVRFRVHL